MRRSASEIINNLENRVARLEKKSGFNYQEGSVFVDEQDKFGESTRWIYTSFPNEIRSALKRLGVGVSRPERTAHDDVHLMEVYIYDGSDKQENYLYGMGTVYSGERVPSEKEIIRRNFPSDDQ